MSGTTPTRRQRWLFGARPTGWSLFVPVTFFLAGLLFALSAGAAKGTDLRASSQDLPGLVRDRSRSLEQQQLQVDRLQGEIDMLTEQRAPYDTELAPLTKQVGALSASGGMTAVKGDGVEVSLNDSDRPLSSFDGAYTADDLVIHQQDVQAYVNALWAGGAEAMMIMDQRVISTSAVRCVGNTLILQGRVYSPPFTITAIGDPARLKAAIDADENIQIVQGYVQEVGLRVAVTEKKGVQLPAYEGTPALRYATVSK